MFFVNDMILVDVGLLFKRCYLYREPCQYDRSDDVPVAFIKVKQVLNLHV